MAQASRKEIDCCRAETVGVRDGGCLGEPVERAIDVCDPADLLLRSC